MSALLDVSSLSVAVRGQGGAHYAVRDISFSIERGEILGIVGESGCGKSLTCLSILGIHASGVYIDSGDILFDGRNLRPMGEEGLCAIRGDDISMIFQEPMTSLDPLAKVGYQVEEPMVLHENKSPKARREEALEILGQVGLGDPEAVYNSYPHQLSGGMRQRAMIAMAIACSPKLLIADEPTTALDVSVQRQILHLLRSINEASGMSILFVSHNLAVIHEIAHRVLVMYAGRVVEEGGVGNVFASPAHPYTKGLLASIPTREKKGSPLGSIPGRVPSLGGIPEGCPFHPRCSIAGDACKKSFPQSSTLGDGHIAYCHALGAMKEGLDE